MTDILVFTFTLWAWN